MAGPFSGPSGYVKVEGDDLPFSSWQGNFEVSAPEWYQFSSIFPQNIGGPAEPSTIELEAPLTSDIVSVFTAGVLYELVLGVGDDGTNPALEIPVSARLLGPGIAVKASEKSTPTMIKYKLKVSGAFPLTIGE